MKILITTLLALLFLSGCVTTDNKHVLNLEKKNKSLYNILSHTYTYIKINRNQKNYEVFKNILFKNTNLSSSENVNKCLPLITRMSQQSLSKDNYLQKYVNCIGQDNIETGYKLKLNGSSAMVNETLLKIAKDSCRYQPNRNFRECVKQTYTPSKMHATMHLNKTTVTIHEDNIYTVIDVILREKRLIKNMTSHIHLYDLYTVKRVALIETDVDYSEIVINIRSHYMIKDQGYYKNSLNNITNLLKSLNLKYTKL